MMRFGSFADAWTLAEDIPGWLTPDQARLLWDEARRLQPGARVLEIGSYQGRSTVVLAAALADSGGQVVAVDPFVDDWKYGSPVTRSRFEEHLARAGVAAGVRLVADYSTAVRPTWTEPLDLLFVDGKHDVLTVLDDLKFAAHVRQGGRLLVHDCFSSVGVTLGVLPLLRPGSPLRFLTRTGSMAVFELGSPGVSDRLRLLAQLPWWARNIGIKVLLRLNLRGLARRAGHDSLYDPF